MHARYILSIAALVAVAVASFPIAEAQMAGPGAGSPMGAGGPMGGQGLHPPQEKQEVAPPALPGASGVGNISAGPVTTLNEDPTKLLFSAINHGDYNQARAAVSRGANLDARNALDETPIELAVELNRNNITFMLLSVRAEEGPGQRAAPQSVTASAVGHTRSAAHAPIVFSSRETQLRQSPARAVAAPIAGSPGVPDPSAGFLGFGGHS